MATPWKHPDTGIFYLRERVPASVITTAKGRTLTIRVHGEAYPVKVGSAVKLSLRTKDTTTAKERFREATAALQEVWRRIQQEGASGPVRLTQRQTEALAGEYYHDLCSDTHENPGSVDDWEEGLSALLDIGETEDGREKLHGKSADHLLQGRGLTIDIASRNVLLLAMHWAFVQYGKHQERRSGGDYSPDPRAGRFPSFDNEPKLTGPAKGRVATTPSAPKNEPKVALTDLFDLWAEKHRAKGKSERTVKDFHHKLDNLRGFLGHDDAEAVTPRNMADWQRHLQTTQGLSAKTVSDKYLAAANRIFTLGVGNFMIEKNPMANLERDKDERAKTRSKGFTDDEAKAILLAALAPSALGGMAEKNKLAIRWTPWLGAYTGARINELTQLRKQDFITEAGIPCIRITPEAGSVKTGEYRIVPLHPHLIEMGLLRFVQAQRDEYLFLAPAETLEGTSTRAENVGKKVSGWVRTGAGVADPRVQPTHGWRHRFKTVARDVGMAPEFADAIQGHSDGRASSDYGETTVKAMYREILKLPRYEWV